MAEMLGMRNHTTVQQWKRYGYIGFQHWQRILGAAVWNDIPVTLHDFTEDVERQYQLDVQKRNRQLANAEKIEEPA